jgi:hypothetical protein
VMIGLFSGFGLLVSLVTILIGIQLDWY